ncbi:hypothetical protein [Streptomyces sp. NPDC012888]|uniref:hypothetical protein n=1 Tax=Streptomyces sp. NPDC012888 TaxID=3364855 RepID=UPI0036B9DC55
MRHEDEGLTTDRLAHPGGEGPPAYPGEATGGLGGGTEAGVGRDFAAPDREEMRREADTTDAVEAEAGADDGAGAGAGTGEAAADTTAEDRQAAGTDTGTGTDTIAATATGGDEEEGEPQLLSDDQAQGFRTTWGEIQGRFVDDPQGAVKDADKLVAEVMQTLAGTFSTHKRELEGQWQQGQDVATEELRLALRRYRSFFDRLLRT